MDNLPLTRQRAAEHLRMVSDEFGAAKDKLPDHVERDRAAIDTLLAERNEHLHRIRKADEFVASLQTHQYLLLSKISRLEAERDDQSSLISDLKSRMVMVANQLHDIADDEAERAQLIDGRELTKLAAMLANKAIGPLVAPEGK